MEENNEEIKKEEIGKKKKNKGIIWFVILILVLILVVGIVVYTEVSKNNKNTEMPDFENNNENNTCEDVDEIIENNNEIITNEYEMDYKPIIYLYPTEETKVNVKLENKDKITCSYPKYIDGWNVLAKTNGDLIDLDTNKNLYALYYESENTVNFKVEKDGFVVKSEDVTSFLEEKLEKLGLTPREAEEFIVYWLPKLESNKYNYIRFATEEEINENMPLEITPKPDTVIRVLMMYKGLEEPINVEEQVIETPERKGFVAVEWGGTEIK